jgi:hypothetical protein
MDENPFASPRAEISRVPVPQEPPTVFSIRRVALALSPTFLILLAGAYFNFVFLPYWFRTRVPKASPIPIVYRPADQTSYSN